MIGRTCLERGRPVVVLICWGTGGGLRNVLIRREDGELVVGPFRGLCKHPAPPVPLTTGQVRATLPDAGEATL